MKSKRLFTQILAIALCLALLCPLCAFAEEADEAPETGGSQVIDPAALEKLLADYVNDKRLNWGKLSVGYCYLDSGDTWYYNGDNWYFGAGVYYVPLMMILAEREHQGVITRETEVGGAPLGDVERYVLTESNNAYAHQVMAYIGSEWEVRSLYRTYSPLPTDYYDSDFMDYSYFSVHFLTDVMKTLYFENERFPNILECMKESDPEQHVSGALNGEFEVAQRYGNFIDQRGVEYNNCTAVVYTPHPFIITVMTQNLGVNDEVIGDLSKLFKDYTLSLDGSYEAAKTQAEEQSPAAAPEEGQSGIQLPGIFTGNKPEEEQPQEEQPAVEQPAVEQPAVEQPAAEQPAAVEPQAESPVLIQPAAEETKPQEQSAPAVQQTQNGKDISNTRRMEVMILAAAIFVVLILAAIIRPILRKKKKG